MADATNPSSSAEQTAQANAQNNAGQAPPRYASPEDVEKLHDTLKSMSDMFVTLSIAIDNLFKNTSKVRDNVHDTTHDLKDSVKHISSLEEEYRTILELGQKISKNGKVSSQDYSLWAKELESIKQSMKDTITSGKANTQQVRAYHRILEQVAKSQEKLSDAKNKGTLNSELEKEIRLMKELHGVTEKLNRVDKTGKRRLSAVNNINRVFKSKAVDKAVEMGVKAHETKQFIREQRDARNSKNSRKSKSFNRHMREIGAHDGEGNWVNLKEFGSKAHLGEDEHEAITKKFGSGGRIDNWLIKKAIKHNTGEAPSRLGKYASKLMERGGGSATEGLTGLVEGGAEGIEGLLAEGAAGFASTAAAPIGIAMGVNKLLDMRADRNKNIEAGLAQGGIFSNSDNAGTNFTNVASNLNNLGGPKGIFQFGRSYDKNLEIAKALVGSGATVSELADNDDGVFGRHRNPNDSKFGPGAYGEIAETAYTSGRIAGLSPTETVSQTMKLVTQYNQSLASTHDFFITITKDTRAAGISTSKYLQVIDGITDGFDRMNKSFQSSVTLLRTLGATGTMTADDMKAYSDVLLKNGQTNNLALRAYQTMNMMSDPNSRDTFLQGRQLREDSAKEQAAGSLRDLGFSDKEVGSLNTSNVDDFITKIGYMPSSVKTQSAGETLRAYVNAANKNKNAQDLKSNPLALAASMESTGQDATDASSLNLAGVKKALSLSGFSMKDLMDRDKQTEIQQSLMNNAGAMQALGSSPTALRDLPELLHATSQDAQKELRNGTLDTGISSDLYDRAVSSGLITGKKGLRAEDKRTAMEQYAKTPGNDHNLQNFLTKQEDILEKMLVARPDLQVTAAEQAASDTKVQQANEATQKLGDVLAKSFEWLFMTLSEPLDKIATLVTGWFGSKGIGNLTDQDHTDMDTYGPKGSRNGDVAKVLDYLNSPAVQTAIANSPEMKAMNSDAKARLEKLRAGTAMTPDELHAAIGDTNGVYNGAADKALADKAAANSPSTSSTSMDDKSKAVAAANNSGTSPTSNNSSTNSNSSGNVSIDKSVTNTYNVPQLTFDYHSSLAPNSTDETTQQPRTQF